MTILIVEGKEEYSKEFVKAVRNLGYETKKINTAKLDSSILALILGREQDMNARNYILENVRKALWDSGSYFEYIKTQLDDFLVNDKSVAIIVNVTTDLRERLESEYSDAAFSVLVGGDEMSTRHDWTVLSENFEGNIKKLLRVLTRDISEL